MGPMGCPETSAKDYQYSLRNNSEGRSSHLLRGGNLKSRGMVQLTNRHINAYLPEFDSWILDHDCFCGPLGTSTVMRPEREGDPMYNYRAVVVFCRLLALYMHALLVRFLRRAI
jgi:hypothetical protein